MQSKYRNKAFLCFIPYTLHSVPSTEFKGEKMTCKERVKLALEHKQTDKVPYEIHFTIPAYEKMQKYYNDDNFIRKIGNHLAFIGTGLPMTEVKPGFFKDEWGAIWDRTQDKDIGNVCKYVLENASDLDKLKMPDPEDERRYSDCKNIIETYQDRFIFSEIGFSFFERAWTLRGMENLLMDMITDEGFVNELLDRILDFNLRCIKKSLNYKVDGFHFGDDWGQQKGLIMGPKLWRKFIKPRIAKMYGLVRSNGLTVSIHSCGDVREVFEDLIEIGLNVFNPFQPEVMDVNEMKKKYGSRLCFYGGLSTQKILPYGTPDDVRKETRRLMKEIGEGGGYILSPAHDIPKDVPAKNIAALIETVQNQ